MLAEVDDIITGWPDLRKHAWTSHQPAQTLRIPDLWDGVPTLGDEQNCSPDVHRCVNSPEHQWARTLRIFYEQGGILHSGVTKNKFFFFFLSISSLFTGSSSICVSPNDSSLSAGGGERQPGKNFWLRYRKELGLFSSLPWRGFSHMTNVKAIEVFKISFLHLILIIWMFFNLRDWFSFLKKKNKNKRVHIWLFVKLSESFF